MPQASSVQRVLPLVVLAITVAVGAGAAHAAAKPKAWDQAAVASLAGKLPRATELLLQAIETESEMVQLPASFGISPEEKRFIRDAQAMHHEAGQLASDLASGKGRTETISSFQRLQKLLGDAKDSARTAFEVEQIYNHFHHVGSLIRRLGPYYVEPE